MFYLRALISMYSPHYPTVLTYMLQSVEYEVGPYLKWLNRAKNFNDVMQRRELNRTRRARILLLGIRVGILAQILLGVIVIVLGAAHKIIGGVYFGLAIIIIYPLLWPLLVTIPLLLGKYLIVLPRDKQLIARSERIFAAHSGVKIAVAGSYGKTTMKELLVTVLREGKKVAATPANKNVAISHAYFALKLAGDEDILVIEYGEGRPGDVTRFARTTHPTHAVITGLAPAHLDHYKTLEAAGQDIFSVTDYVELGNVYVNADSPSLQSFIKPLYHEFNDFGALGWKVEAVKLEISGTGFTLSRNKIRLNLHSGLVGRHHLGFLAFVAAFGLEMGLTNEQVQRSIAKTVPFEHRMQPYRLGGAWIIDDTYNGNLEGIRAGTELLQTLDVERKIYVTPGLVDQGAETKAVHQEVGRLIAAASPQIVVLMQNSVTDYIRQGLEEANFIGEVRIETDPLEFYINLKHFVAAGDLVVMQNDWTDNYV